MAKAKTRLTKNQQEWKKQEQRIKRIQRDLLKQGFVFEDTFKAAPVRPRVITAKRIKEIKAIKPETIRQQALIKPSWYGPNRKTPPKAPIVPKITSIILEQVREQIYKWDADIFFDTYSDYFKKVKTQDKKILNNILEGAISRDGEDAVAARLEASSTEILEIIQFVLYASGGKTGREETQMRLVRFAQLLQGGQLSPEENKALTRYQELMEGET